MLKKFAPRCVSSQVRWRAEHGSKEGLNQSILDFQARIASELGQRLRNESMTEVT